MGIEFERYADQLPHWPRAGRHVLAQSDADTVVVYQAYNPTVARHAVARRAFGAGFSYNRMSWVKPNFLWMMFRSGWGTKPDQEVTLALRVRRAFFDGLLRAAVPSGFAPALYPDEAAWKRAVAGSDVRLQWDPDHHPTGAKLDRRAVQLGVRGETLGAFGRRELLDVVDLSDFVAGQRDVLAARGASALVTPRERVYAPADGSAAANVGLDVWPEPTSPAAPPVG